MLVDCTSFPRSETQERKNDDYIQFPTIPRSPHSLLAMVSACGLIQLFQHICDHARRSRLLAVPDVSDVLASDPRKADGTVMISLVEWPPPALVGTTVRLLGSLKLDGLWRGVAGGADKPFVTRLCGT
jgi:hypothetical protein